MSRIIRTVSLDRETDELAATKPNFSGWVREQLKIDSQKVSLIHVTKSMFKSRGICNPSASPRCSICFPHGKPPRSKIREWNTSHLGNEWLQNETKKHYEGITADTVVTKDKDEPFTPPLRQRKYVRRALKWVINFI